jgi:polar amino acid transport system substrate-binding protein
MNSLPRCGSCLLFSLLVLLGPRFSFGERLLISTAHTPPRSTPQDNGYEDLILFEAFRRIGVEITFLRAPSARSIVDANNGYTDGNFGRVPGLESRFPNLVMVPEKLDDFQFSVFAKDPKLRLPDWNAIKSFNVAFVSGWIILEKRTAGAKFISQVKDGPALFLLLDQDRTDLIVYDLQQGRWLLKKLGLKNIFPISPPIETSDMYLYLNKKHERLAPALAAALRSMREEGVIQKLTEDTLQGLTQP